MSKTETIIRELYNGEEKIIFYPNSHRYRKDGERSYLLGTTTVTGKLDKSRALIAWATRLQSQFIRDYMDSAEKATFHVEELLPIIAEAEGQHQVKKEKASSIGSEVHEFAESFARAKMGLREMPKIDENYAPEVINGINAFLSWYNEHDVEFIASEKLVYSRKYGHVGTFDLVARIDGVLTLCDYKTAKGIYSPMFYQLAGYRAAYNEEMEYIGGEKVNKGAILNFSKETGEFAVQWVNKTEHKKDLRAFLGLLATAKREKERGKR